MKVITWAAISTGLIDERENVENIDSVIEYFDWNKLSKQNTRVDADAFQ